VSLGRIATVTLLAAGSTLGGLLLAYNLSSVHDATITVANTGPGNRCDASPNPEPIVTVSGDEIRWTLVNKCANPPNRRMRVRFPPPPTNNPMDPNCTLEADVLANGPPVTLAACTVVEPVTHPDVQSRKYEAHGGDHPLDPQLEIHGPEPFLPWLAGLWRRIIG
jgi:hypothetical protein